MICVHARLYVCKLTYQLHDKETKFRSRYACILQMRRMKLGILVELNKSEVML